MSTVRVLGEFGLGALFPSLLGLLGAVQADIEGNLAGALAAAAEVSIELPSVTAAISAAEEIILNLTSGGIGFSAQVELDLIASLEASLRIIGIFLGAFGGSAKAEVFQVTSQANEFGSLCNGEVGAGIQGGSPTDTIQAVVIVTRYPAFMDALFKILLA